MNSITEILSDKDWEFFCNDWRETLRVANEEDFVYLDPPYVGRHTDYFNSWTDEDAIDLSTSTNNLNCQFA